MQQVITREEALQRLKATKEAKARRIEILKRRMCEKYKERTGTEPRQILFI